MFNGLGTDPVSSNWYVLYSIWLSLHFDAGGANRCTLTAPSKEGLASQKLCRRRELPPVWVEQGGIEFKSVLQLKLDGLRWGDEWRKSASGFFCEATHAIPILPHTTLYCVNTGSVFYKRVTQKAICCGLPTSGWCSCTRTVRDDARDVWRRRMMWLVSHCAITAPHPLRIALEITNR